MAIGIALGLIPHIAIKVDDDSEEGAFPATPQDWHSVYKSVPGAVHPEQSSDPDLTVKFTVTKEQADRIRAYIRAHGLNPSNYQLEAGNCATFVHDALKAGRVRGNAPQFVISPLAAILWDLAAIPGATVTQSSPEDLFVRADNTARSTKGRLW